METITFEDFALLWVGAIAIAMISGGLLSWALTYWNNKED